MTVHVPKPRFGCMVSLLLLVLLLFAMSALGPSVVAAAGSTCSKTAPAGQLRFLTFNVRRFKGEDGASSAAAIGRMLASLAPTVVALNEVDTRREPQALSALAQQLGGYQVAFFGHAGGGHYGNALLSRHRILAVRETHLRGGTEVEIPSGRHRIGRGLLECDIELAPPGCGGQESTVVTVAVTHLDHMSEEQRSVQVQHLLEALGPNQARTLLMGDFNALNRSDYTDREWISLEDRAASNQWSLPVPSGSLEALGSAGFVDAFLASRGGSPLGSDREALLDAAPPMAAAAAAATDGGIFTAHVGHPVYRIDYCFFARQLGWMPAAAAVQTDVHLSDHFPVVFDFDLPSAGGAAKEVVNSVEHQELSN